MTAHEQDLNEMIAVLNARLESRHIEATEQSGQIGDLKRELAEVREKLSNAVVQADAHFTTYLEEIARRDALATQVATIRTLITEDYGTDYDDEDVAAAVERLMRHLSEHEANVQRILQSKNEALKQAEDVIEKVRELLFAFADWPDRDATDFLFRLGRHEMVYRIVAYAFPDELDKIELNPALDTFCASERTGGVHRAR